MTLDTICGYATTKRKPTFSTESEIPMKTEEKVGKINENVNIKVH